MHNVFRNNHAEGYALQRFHFSSRKVNNYIPHVPIIPMHELSKRRLRILGTYNEEDKLVGELNSLHDRVSMPARGLLNLKVGVRWWIDHPTLSHHTGS